MKKSVITTLLVITVGFASYIGGVYSSRNLEQSNVYISGISVSDPTLMAQPIEIAVPTKQPVDTQNASIPSTTLPATTVPAGPLMININTATLEELDLLPGIGPVIAQAIIDYRSEYGNFETPEDLLNIKGIGEKRLEAILEFITTGG